MPHIIPLPTLTVKDVVRSACTECFRSRPLTEEEKKQRKINDAVMNKVFLQHMMDMTSHPRFIGFPF